MVNENEEITEGPAYLEKPSGRKGRRDKSTKARLHHERRKAKKDREYEDGFGGNYE